jgi:hypothetical protein
MGTTAFFVVVHGEVPNDRSHRTVASVGGWTICKPPEDYVNVSALEGLAVQLAAIRDSTSVAAFVEDSDIGYAAAATADGVVSRLLFGDREGAEGYEDGWEALHLIGDNAASAPESFAMWAELNGTVIEGDTIRGLVDADWTFAEEAVTKLFVELGVSLPWDRL